mgnify:CR=1 FL=1
MSDDRNSDKALGTNTVSARRVLAASRACANCSVPTPGLPSSSTEACGVMAGAGGCAASASAGRSSTSILVPSRASMALLRDKADERIMD